MRSQNDLLRIPLLVAFVLPCIPPPPAWAQATARVSVDDAGNQANATSERASLSSDGRYIAFQSTATNLVPGDTNGVSDVFVHDRLTGTTERVSVDSSGAQADGASTLGSIQTFTYAISGDGRHVVFRSSATNLVAGDTNGAFDVFLRDRQTSF